MTDEADSTSTVNVTVQTPNQPAAPPLQPITVLPPKAARTFSKWMVVANCALAWAAIFASIFFGQAAYVALGGFAMVAVFGAGYMGIGHKDLALLMRSLAPVQIGGPTEMQEPPTFIHGVDNAQ